MMKSFDKVQNLPFFEQNKTYLYNVSEFELSIDKQEETVLKSCLNSRNDE